MRTGATSPLARELAHAVEGEVRFDAGGRALYATDLSIYRQVPIGVVVPRTVDDIVKTVEICRAHGAPLLGRGGGTSLVGQCTNEAVVIDCSKYLNRILEIDPEKKLARVEPGVVCDDLKFAAEEHGLTWGPDPATHQYANVGGMLGNNSCGVHSVLTEFYGGGPRTADNVEELEVVTYRGDRLRVGREDDRLPAELVSKLRAIRDRYGELIRERYPQIPRRVSGYNLDELLPERGFHIARSLVGTESTCAITLEATLRLVDNPRHRALLVLGYPDQYVAADQIVEIREQRPIGIECVDHTVTDNMKQQGMHPKAVALYPDGGAWLLVEFGGESAEEAADRAHALERELGPDGPVTKLVEDAAEQKLVWLVRESSIGASRIPRKLETWPTFEDAAVAPEKLGAYLRDFKKLLDEHGLYCVFFGHYGQGCVHARIGFDLKTADGIKGFRRFHEDATELVLSYGGSLSGEHGDGQAHGWALEKMYGPELIEAFREFKRAWDPDGKLNPGKKIDAYAPDANLRLGPGYRPAQPKTHFSFHEDGFSFAAATERCFGVGLCRKHDTGTMCPSYMATREEKHTTRGRAHLLFELLRGEVIGRDGWRDEAVKDALDLCLSCKGCKGECPVQVDIATYKAEFLAHYYARRLRPRIAYALGLVPWWARLAERAPRFANALTAESAPGRMLKRAAGIAPERELPRLADESFKAWFRRRDTGVAAGERVIVWPDTFTNHFHPHIGRAAVDVLEAAGLRVEVPQATLCCGRPLFDFGMLRLAKRWLRRILDELRPAIAEGVPIVGLEPSCLAVFRDELPNLLPHDEDAKRLSGQAFLLSEFLERRLEGWQPPKLARKALVHGHCHHKALMKLDDEESVLTKLGLDFEVVDSGCCGMAGSFGYDAGEHYAVSMTVGERVLLPAVRRAGSDTLIVADGFSCREQIAHATGRKALHLAEVIQTALNDAGAGPGGQAETQRRAALAPSSPR
ncbi:MAG TPA: FAD-linked oxidase C-terminal domain-containing protein [Gaiellaceae bacterium]|jgi:FAD/FMN-containing dehydrogenase/Fe-S oxidoreductase|nr:FAD-linked oxidase C-terminal domain-containing protein [Gaiellaceae bacterium]